MALSLVKGQPEVEALWTVVDQYCSQIYTLSGKVEPQKRGEGRYSYVSTEMNWSNDAVSECKK